MAKKRLTKQVVKKKKWYTIVAPKLLGERQIGETYLEDPETAKGRKVKVNLMQVTGDMKTQNSAVKFEITGLTDTLLKTRIIGYYFLPASIKRLVRRRMTRVDDSIVAMTKDNVKIRIKPLVLTRGKVSKSVDNRLRISVREELVHTINKISYEELFLLIIKNRLQRDLKTKFSKINPIRSVLIRVLKEETHHAAAETVVKGVAKKTEKVETTKEEKLKETKTEVKTEKKEEKPVETKEEKKEEAKKQPVKEETKKEEKPTEKPTPKKATKLKAEKKPAKKEVAKK